MPTAEEIEESNALTGSPETPHTKWAKPYAHGTVRVLFLMQQQASVNVLPLRQAVEIMQRFDIAGDAVLVMKGAGEAYATTYAGGSGVFGAALGEQRLARLLEERYDGFVVAGEVLGHLPAAARDAIVAQVREGAGLVFLYRVGEAEAPLLSGAEPVERASPWLDGLETTRWRMGRGRVIAHSPPVWRIYLRQPESVYGLAHLFGTDLSRDCRFEAQGRVILWAVRREPKATLAITVPKQPLDVDRLPHERFRVTWSGVPTEGSFELETRVRSHSRGAKRYLNLRASAGAEGEVIPPETAMDYSLEGLPAGRYVVDARARSDRGVEAWAVRPLTIASAVHIVGVALDRPWGEVGQPIEGAVTVDTGHVEGLRLRVQIIDRHAPGCPAETPWRSTS